MFIPMRDCPSSAWVIVEIPLRPHFGMAKRPLHATVLLQFVSFVQLVLIMDRLLENGGDDALLKVWQKLDTLDLSLSLNRPSRERKARQKPRQRTFTGFIY